MENKEQIEKEVAIEYHRLMSEWVSVDERLPELGVGILIYLKSGYIGCGYRSKEQENDNLWVFYHTDMELKNDKLTHWMPLPQPPQK